MIRLLADENFNDNIVRGIRLRSQTSTWSESGTSVSPAQTTRRCWSGQPNISAYC